jgi:hypothetical protein
LLYQNIIGVTLLLVLVSFLPTGVLATPISPGPNTTALEPSPSPCYFDPTLKECQPIDGTCQPGFSLNENVQCIPHGDCPKGYGRLDDDETGKCYKNNEIQICPDGYITHINRECPASPPPN